MGISKTTVVLKPSGRGENSFMPGDTVRGAVVIHIAGSSASKLTEVTLKVKGQARTHWTTHNGTWSSKHSQKESFFKLILPVLPVKKGAATLLPPGENQLNFSFSLPPGLPHSREYTHGEVVYTMSARAVSSQLPWLSGSGPMPLTVLQRLDLNLLPQLTRRLVVERKPKSGSRRDDPGTFTVTLARQGFVAGDTVDVYVEAEDEVLLALARQDGLVKVKRYEEFRAGSSSQNHKPVLEQRRLGLDPAEWRHFQLTMPQDDIGIDPDVCHIIAASHYVKIWDVHLPLTLGTIGFGKRSSSRPPSRNPSAVGLGQTPSRSPSGVGLWKSPSSLGMWKSPSGVGLCQTPSRSPSGVGLSQIPSKAPSRTPSGVGLNRSPSKSPLRTPSEIGFCQSASKAALRTPSDLGLCHSPTETPLRRPSDVGLCQTPYKPAPVEWEDSGSSDEELSFYAPEIQTDQTNQTNQKNETNKSDQTAVQTDHTNQTNGPDPTAAPDMESRVIRPISSSCKITEV